MSESEDRKCLLSEGSCKAADCPQHGWLVQKVVDLKTWADKRVEANETHGAADCSVCTSVDAVFAELAETAPWVLDLKQKLPYLDSNLVETLCDEIVEIIDQVARDQFERGRIDVLEQYDIREDC